MLTPGVDKATLDGISTADILSMHQQLKNRSYKYGPLRRIHMTKPGKVGTRPLSLASPKDNLVQQAFKRVMEVCLEGVGEKRRVDQATFRAAQVGPGLKFTRTSKGEKTYYVRQEIIPTLFHKDSHGLRPGRSCHTALESIKKS